MTKDFSKYQKTINQFRGKVSLSDFDAKFLAITHKMAKTEKFLLKMELKRLANPCTRLIDLRGLVDGECKNYEHQGRSHILDDLAIKVFEENVAHYGDYTFGVYEAVKNTKNNFRVIYQNTQPHKANINPADDKVVLEKTQYPAKFYQIGRYHNRKEERMNFAMPLSITLENKQIVESTSSDISGEGCKFRFIEQQNLNVGHIITIRFVGLEKDFQFGNDDNFTYQICNVFVDNKTQLVGAKRININKTDRFKTFLLGFIQGNKRRYKINLDNTINALQARCFEQYILPKSNELPIFIEQKNNQVIPRFVLTSNNSQSTFQYWQDESRNSALHCLVNKERVKYLAKTSTQQRSLLVYSFVHQNKGQSFFYSADEQQLKQQPKFMGSFLGFAASKASFSITLLSYIPIDKNLAFSPYTLSDSLRKKDEYLNAPPSEDVLSIIENLSAIVVASDVTQQFLTEQYQQYNFDNIDTHLLKSFGHKRLAKPILVDELGINYKNHRQEPRFKYRTPAVIEIKGGEWSGVSNDFSISGLKIEIDNGTSLTKGDVVNLSFPTLQKITSEFDLKDLPYEVIKINKKKNIINFRVYVKKHQHIGRAFFKLLIEKNREKLTPDEYAKMIPGLDKALRTLYANSLVIPSLIVQTSGSRYKIETIAASDEYGDLLPQMRGLSDRKNYYNLYPLLNNLQLTHLLYSKLKKMLAGDDTIVHTVFIAINDNIENIEQTVTTKLASELNSNQLQAIFIRSALKKGRFYCIQMKLSRADEPDMEYLNPELSYISSYAIHRGKQIEQEIWSVAGVVQFVDITSEAMFRNHLTTSH